ncbi:MAG: flavodoxin [Candidatus Buchananbacteria bacterium]
MKSLIIFYSLDGNTRFLANEMAKEIGADLLELKPEKSINAGNFMKYFWGGKQVMMNERPKLLAMENKPADYELSIIGTPVWASNFAPVFKTFFSEVKIRDKKIGLFCSCGASAGNAINNFRDELTGNNILSEMVFINPLRKPEENSTIAKEWVRKMVQ